MTCTVQYAHVQTIQCPVVWFGQHGSSAVQYVPLTFVSYRVDFPSTDGTGHTRYILGY